ARHARRVVGPERLRHARPEVAQPHAYTLSRTGRSANASSGVAATAASRVSVGYPVRSTTNPDTAPPTAPARPIPTSARPCADGLTDSGTDSLSSAEPATIVPDHPSPSRNSPAVSCAESCPAVPATAQATSSSTRPPRITRRRPYRSVSHPVTGANAY